MIHTPKPWVTQGNLEIGLSVVDSMENEICQVFCIDGDEESEANARLIAAAPILLEAAKGLSAALLSAHIDMHQIDMKAWDAMQDAIAAAEKVRS